MVTNFLNLENRSFEEVKLQILGKNPQIHLIIIRE